MEHKLILGGEQYLPYARSRVKALRATGMAYGSQRFDLGDAVVEVQIKLDQDYIKITGGSCTLAMDSGVVDVRSVAEQSPDSFLPGVMHYTSAGIAYNAAFVLPESGGDWLLNPSASSSAQLAGTIKGDKSGKFKGKLPADKTVAASFTPRPELSNSTVPATWVQAKHDETLWIKKITAVLCPASVFTGRTRLYVQALYGRHLYTLKGDSVTTDAVNIGLVYGSPPYITIPSFRASGDNTEYGDVAILTSSGVHLDRVTGKHWLLSIANDGVHAIPLVGDSCAESMRKFLKTPYPSGLPALSTEALERLETYVLSRCLPDSRNTQIAACALGMSFYSMGYSWHWNYSGTAADIVVNDQFIQHPENEADGRAAMISSHYRVTVSLAQTDAGPVWTAGLTNVELGVRWYINRTYWVIAEPDIARGVFLKTTPRRSELFACDAPFYAFYTGDALQVCRVNFSIHQPDPPTHTESEDLYHAGIAGSLGDRAGYARDKDFGSEYYTCNITCGELSTGDMLWGHVVGEANKEFSKVSKVRIGPRYSDDDGYQYNRSYSFGYPPYQVAGPFDTTIANTSYVETGDHDIETTTVREEWLSVATVVVPPSDSEAVYLQAAQTKYRTKTGAVSHWTYGWFGYTTRVNLYSAGSFGPPMFFTTYGWNAFGAENGFSLGSDTPVYEYTETAEINIMSLICKAGTVQLNEFSDIAGLHDPTSEEATGSFRVRSGASIANPVVLADKASPVGIAPGVGLPVFVGYV